MQERQKELLDLLSLKDDSARIKSRKFQKVVGQCKGLIVWWKRRFGLSSNDPRFLTATMTQILEDAVEEMGIRYIEDFEIYDAETNEFLRRRAVDPNYDETEKERLARGINRLLGFEPEK